MQGINKTMRTNAESIEISYLICEFPFLLTRRSCFFVMENKVSVLLFYPP